jgi:Kef-type K+ transport system membrane component KefB
MVSEGGVFTGRGALDSPLSRILVQTILVIFTSRLLAAVGKKLNLKQPLIIWEIFAGILLGPSAFARIPAVKTYIFPNVDNLGIIANLGLVFYLFFVGLEMDIKDMRSNLKRSLLISLSGIIVPCILGIGASYIVFNNIESNPQTSFVPFALFLGVAMSITVSSKI